MNTKQFNEERHNRRLQCYRLSLGMQQFRNHPIINIIWLLFPGMNVVVKKIINRWTASIDINPIFEDTFSVSMIAISIIILALVVIAIIQFVGLCSAIKDESDMEYVFGDKRDINNQTPILIYKKKDRTW